MINIFNLWQVNLFLYYIFVVLYFQNYRLAVKNAKIDGAATILLQVIGGASVLLLMPFFKFSLPNNINTYILLLIATVFYGIYDRLQTPIRKHLSVSTVSVLSQIASVYLIIIGIVIFKEEVMLKKLVGAALILLANIFIFYKKGKLSLNKHAWIAIVSSLIFAIAVSIDVGISSQFNLPFYVAITLILPAFGVKFIEKIKLSSIKNEFKNSVRKHYLIAGVSWGLLIVFMIRTYQMMGIATVAPLASVSVLLNVLVAHFFQREQDNLFKKIIASMLVIIGIYLTI